MGSTLPPSPVYGPNSRFSRVQKAPFQWAVRMMSLPRPAAARHQVGVAHDTRTNGCHSVPGGVRSTQVRPSHSKATGPSLPERLPAGSVMLMNRSPTARHRSGAAQDTSVTADGGGGVGDHADPSHRTAAGASPSGPGVRPMARQNDGPTHDTRCRSVRVPADTSVKLPPPSRMYTGPTAREMFPFSALVTTTHIVGAPQEVSVGSFA